MRVGTERDTPETDLKQHDPGLWITLEKDGQDQGQDESKVIFVTHLFLHLLLRESLDKASGFTCWQLT
jgi:hypothetical protein